MRRTLAFGLLLPLFAALPTPWAAGAADTPDEAPALGSRWLGFVPAAGPAVGRARAAALAPDGSLLLAGSTDPQRYGIAKVALPTGTPRADFGRNGYADLTDVLPSGTPLDIAARADGGAYLLLEGARRLRLWEGVEQPLTVGVTSITADGRPDPAFGSVPNFGQVGTRYLSPRQDAEITGVGGIALGAGGRPVVAYTERLPGEVTETNPAPSPRMDVVLRRLEADGTVDTTYGDGGLARWVEPLLLQPGTAGSVEVERVRAAGGGSVLVLVKSLVHDTGTSARTQRLRVLRFTAAGDLDPGFGQGGALEVADSRPDCGPGTDAGIRTPLAVGDDGRFVVASSRVEGNGWCAEPVGDTDGSDLLVNVYEADGTPDTSFSSDGRLRHHVTQRETPGDPSSQDLMRVNQPEAVLLDRLGRVVVTAVAGTHPTGGLVRFDPNGAVDEEFGVAAGLFDVPPPYDGGDLLETATDDYVLLGAPYEPFAHRSAAASMYLADGDLPTTPETPVPDPSSGPRLVPRTDRALRPGDELVLETGTWSGPPIEHFEIAWLGCESRHATDARCVDQPLGRSVVGPDATATFVLPEHAAGQYLSADVVAVTADGRRGVTTVFGGTAGPSRHLIEETPDTGLRDLTNGRFGAAEVYSLSDGTVGAVYGAFSQVFDGRLRIMERGPDSPGGTVVVARDDIKNVVVEGVVTTADDWVHVVVTAGVGGNLYATSRDPGTGLWSEVAQVSNVSDEEGVAHLRVGQGGVSAGPDGRLVVAWAEEVPRGDDAPAPVAVRVRTPEGWQPVHYLPEPLELSCGDGTRSCFPDPAGDGRTFDATAPHVAVTEAGAVSLVWQRRASIHLHLFSQIAFAARMSAAGVWTAPAPLVPLAKASLTPARLAPMADGRMLFLARETVDLDRESLVLQVVPAGGLPAPDLGDGLPGRVLRTYGEVDGILTTDFGDGFPDLAVDGTHWRLAISEQVARGGKPTLNRLLVQEGTGDELAAVQVLDRRMPNSGAYDVTFAASPGGRALLVTESQADHPTDLEYSLAEGNGPMTRLQPVATELAGGSVSLVGAPETGVSGETRDLAMRQVRGSWELTTLSRVGALRSHRLAEGAAGPRVAVADGRTPRPGKPYVVAVDQERSLDPDGGDLTYGWDLDGDGAFDDATGPSVSLVAPEAQSELVVAVRATSTDGDRAVARASVYPRANEAPVVYQLDGPTTAVAGDEVLFEAWALDDDSEDLLTYAWYVGNIAQPAQTGPSARLALPAGSVQVRVVATDADGASGESSRTVQVAPAVVPNQPPTVSLTGPASAVDGDVVRFVATAKDDGGAGGLRYTWKVDGVTVPGASGARADLVLATGARAVSVTVRDAAGLTATRSRSVRVTVSGSRLPDRPVRFVSLTGSLLKITATVPKKGKLTVVLRKAGSATVLARATVKVPGRGVRGLSLKLTAAGVKALRAKGSHTVDAVSTFVPQKGARQVRTHRVTVVRR